MIIWQGLGNTPRFETHTSEVKKEDAMAGISNRMVGLISVIVLLVGAWVVLRFLINVLIWPIVSELWFPLVIIIVVVLLFLLFSKRK
jgi:hypothetical protein